MAQIPQRIRELRLSKHLTHEALAFKSGLSVATVQRAEAGKHSASVRTLEAIACGLGVSLTEVIAHHEPEAKAG